MSVVPNKKWRRSVWIFCDSMVNFPFKVWELWITYFMHHIRNVIPEQQNVRHGAYSGFGKMIEFLWDIIRAKCHKRARLLPIHCRNGYVDYTSCLFHILAWDDTLQIDVTRAEPRPAVKPAESPNSSPWQTSCLYSLNSDTSYRQISWNIGAARMAVIMIVSLWNLTHISATLLLRCLSKFGAIGKV